MPTNQQQQDLGSKLPTSGAVKQSGEELFAIQLSSLQVMVELFRCSCPGLRLHPLLAKCLGLKGDLEDLHGPRQVIPTAVFAIQPFWPIELFISQAFLPFFSKTILNHPQLNLE